MSIIAISGKINNGKDAVGEIINYLCRDDKDIDFNTWKKENLLYHPWTYKKFADKLKDTICLWLGCTREQLEDRDFKETPLPEMWWKYTDGVDSVPYLGGDTNMLDGYNTVIQKTTPRILLQQLGTECGRDIIHRDIWVNATLSEYKAANKGTYNEEFALYSHYACKNCYKPYSGSKRQHLCKTCIEDDSVQFYPNWIITDCRFPNEAEAIKDKGISVRVNRPLSQRFPDLWKLCFQHTLVVEEITEKNFFLWLERHDLDMWKKLTHLSETALDNYESFDYVIDNNGTFDELIKKVKDILVLEEIL